MVLENYPGLRFCRILPNQKIPFEKSWQNKPYTIEQIQEHILNGENYGVLCGLGGLIVIDADRQELQEAVKTQLPITHRVQTGGGGIHNYFFCESTQKIVLTKAGIHYGEVQGKGSQVVGANSTHPNGNKYLKLDENPIATISKEELMKLVAQFIDRLPEFSEEQSTEPYFEEVINKLLPYWNEGDRQNKALLLAGFLRKHKRLGIQAVKTIISQICSRAKDSEIAMRLRAVDDTFKKNESEIKGISGLEELNLKELDKPKIKSPILDVKTYRDYEKIKPDKNYLVQGMISPKSLNMLYSPPAQFKSLLAFNMALCVATGKKFLGLKTRKNPVLYFDGENNQMIISDRWKKQHKGMNQKRKNYPFYCLTSGLIITEKKQVDEQFIFQISETIKKYNIKFLIFDTLHRFAFYDENKSDDLNLLYVLVFKPLIEQFGVSILFLHHSTKPDRRGRANYRGSSDLMGQVDTAFFVSRYSKEKFKLFCEKSRNGELEPISGDIEFAEDYIKINRDSVLQEEPAKKLDKLKEVTARIKDYSSKHEGKQFKRKDFIDDCELNNFDFGSTKTIDRALKWLVDNQFLDKDGSGGYTLIAR